MQVGNSPSNAGLWAQIGQKSQPQQAVKVDKVEQSQKSAPANTVDRASTMAKKLQLQKQKTANSSLVNTKAKLGSIQQQTEKLGPKKMVKNAEIVAKKSGLDATKIYNIGNDEKVSPYDGNSIVNEAVDKASRLLVSGNSEDTEEAKGIVDEAVKIIKTVLPKDERMKLNDNPKAQKLFQMTNKLGVHSLGQMGGRSPREEEIMETFRLNGDREEALQALAGIPEDQRSTDYNALIRFVQGQQVLIPELDPPQNNNDDESPKLNYFSQNNNNNQMALGEPERLLPLDENEVPVQVKKSPHRLEKGILDDEEALAKQKVVRLPDTINNNNETVANISKKPIKTQSVQNESVNIKQEALRKAIAQLGVDDNTVKELQLQSKDVNELIEKSIKLWGGEESNEIIRSATQSLLKSGLKLINITDNELAKIRLDPTRITDEVLKDFNPENPTTFGELFKKAQGALIPKIASKLVDIGYTDGFDGNDAKQTASTFLQSNIKLGSKTPITSIFERIEKNYLPKPKPEQAVITPPQQINTVNIHFGKNFSEGEKTEVSETINKLEEKLVGKVVGANELKDNCIKYVNNINDIKNNDKLLESDKLKLRGYLREAQVAIGLSNLEGEEVVELGWAPTDRYGQVITDIDVITKKDQNYRFYQVKTGSNYWKGRHKVTYENSYAKQILETDSLRKQYTPPGGNKKVNVDKIILVADELPGKLPQESEKEINKIKGYFELLVSNFDAQIGIERVVAM